MCNHMIPAEQCSVPFRHPTLCSTSMLCGETHFKGDVTDQLVVLIGEMYVMGVKYRANSSCSLVFQQFKGAKKKQDS